MNEGTATVLRANSRHLPVADDSVDLIVTSPPYYGMRSYQDGGAHYDGQIGAERTHVEYVDSLIEVTRECMRVLKPTGSLWVNLGDKYSANWTSARGNGGAGFKEEGRVRDRHTVGVDGQNMRPKSLIGIPWRYALRCIDDLGLILRAEVVWSKPNGLPESVTDRVRRSHETWFHLTLRPRYYSAVDEIREPHLMKPQRRSGRPEDLTPRQGQHRQAWPMAGRDEPGVDGHPMGKLPGSVWVVPTEPLVVPARLGVTHFAAFPSEWPKRIIPGWSPAGVCTACGQGRRPVVATVALDMSRPQARRAHELAEQAGLTEAHFQALLSVGVSDTGRGAATQTGTGRNTAEVYVLADRAREVLGGYAREYLLRRPTGFDYVCGCSEPTAPTTPAVVLDPFGGTGTTALVAKAQGRHGITVDMSGDYCRVAAWRTNDPIQLDRARRPIRQYQPPVPKPEPGPALVRWSN